ncbi:MAG: T9SS type A sorting domain-containing protein [Candidatus Sabulitectum sp.]|nr:T9SS type A sorting domain-containing protein [Candidatus Sabulitectum sp.]
MKIALIMVLMLSLSVFADTVYQRIEGDHDLTVDQRARYLVYSVLDRSKLPVEYTTDADCDRSGTPALHEATLLYDQVSNATLEEILTLANRPNLSGSPVSFVSADGNFRIHYTTTGADACTQSYAETISTNMVYSWLTECNTMGYITPPPDNNVGGDNLYDIYVCFLSGGTLGYTSSGGEYKPPDSTQSCSASHIVMGSTLGTNHAMVTSSHEFQHAIQMSYDYEEPTWFMENCAVWMEDQVYDDINDYLNYYSVGAMRKPYMGIDSGSMYWYGASYWPRMMGLMFGIEAVREVWENCSATNGPNMWDAQSDMFEAHGITFENGFMLYGLWRYMVGPQWGSTFNLFDEEADTWGTPLVFSWHNFTSLPGSGDQGSYPQYLMDDKGIAWIKVKLEDYQGGWVQFDFDGRDYFEWNIGAIIYNDSDFQFIWVDCDETSGDKTIAVPTEGWDYAIFFPAFMTETSLTANYTFDLSFSTGIEEGESLTNTDLTIGSNPMVAGSSVSFNAPFTGHADLSVIDMAGRRVSTMFSGEAVEGLHTVEFQGDLAPGTYFVVLRHGNSVETSRVSVLR